MTSALHSPLCSPYRDLSAAQTCSSRGSRLSPNRLFPTTEAHVTCQRRKVKLHHLLSYPYEYTYPNRPGAVLSVSEFVHADLLTSFHLCCCYCSFNVALYISHGLC